MFICSQELLSVHDTVRARTYETPIPAFDPNFHPSTHYSRHRKGGETRTVGLHKSANESLVSAWGDMQSALQRGGVGGHVSYRG